MDHDPLLASVDDKIPFLRVFAQRLRDGRSSRSGKPIGADHVADEVYHIAKTFQELGARDPRLNAAGHTDLRFRNLLQAFRNQDPAPTRVKPLPIQVLHHAQRACSLTPDPRDSAAMDMLWIAYFFLLRPGEYVKARDNDPLRLRDVTLLIHHRALDFFTCPLSELARVTHATITFDTQKNRVRGEVIGHSRSGDPRACPVLALVRRIQHLRTHHASNDTFLCTYYSNNQPFVLYNKVLNDILKVSAAALPSLNYRPSDISPRSLRSGGAMALLCGRIDTDVIKLVGRWRSDAIFRYLHAQALPIISNLASIMVRHGNYHLLPGNNIPPPAAPILRDEAAAIADLNFAWTQVPT